MLFFLANNQSYYSSTCICTAVTHHTKWTKYYDIFPILDGGITHPCPFPFRICDTLRGYSWTFLSFCFLTVEKKFISPFLLSAHLSPQHFAGFHCQSWILGTDIMLVTRNFCNVFSLFQRKYLQVCALCKKRFSLSFTNVVTVVQEAELS